MKGNTNQENCAKSSRFSRVWTRYPTQLHPYHHWSLLLPFSSMFIDYVFHHHNHIIMQFIPLITQSNLTEGKNSATVKAFYHLKSFFSKWCECLLVFAFLAKGCSWNDRKDFMVFDSSSSLIDWNNCKILELRSSSVQISVAASSSLCMMQKIKKTSAVKCFSNQHKGPLSIYLTDWGQYNDQNFQLPEICSISRAWSSTGGKWHYQWKSLRNSHPFILDILSPKAAQSQKKECTSVPECWDDQKR